VGAEAIDNTRGTAPGIHIEKNGVSVFLLPGPPEEMKAMLDLSVLPILKQRTHQLVLSRFFNICDMGESMVEEAILDLVKDQDNPTIATYAKPGEVLIRVTANGTDEAQVNALLDQYSKAIETRFGRHIFAHSSDPLSKAVADLLIKKGMTLAIADSGTGGMAGEILSGIDGMAKVFKLGLVVNDSQMKAKLLGVDSKAAGATAKQLFAISDCDINVAVSDLAKMPDDPLSAEVEIAICAGGKLQTETCRFKGSRRMIQTRAAIKVFGMIREVLL
jgi:nicotinamide-nucleotide amidase